MTAQAKPRISQQFSSVQFRWVHFNLVQKCTKNVPLFTQWKKKIPQNAVLLVLFKFLSLERKRLWKRLGTKIGDKRESPGGGGSPSLFRCHRLLAVPAPRRLSVCASEWVSELARKIRKVDPGIHPGRWSSWQLRTRPKIPRLACVCMRVCMRVSLYIHRHF